MERKRRDQLESGGRDLDQEGQGQKCRARDLVLDA